MPDQVERFNPSHRGPDPAAAMYLNLQGGWVGFPDYEKLERELETVKQAWLDADKEKVKEHTAIYAAATDRRRELEAQLADVRDRLDAESEIAEALEIKLDTARKQRDEKLKNALEAKLFGAIEPKGLMADVKGVINSVFEELADA